MTRRQLASHIRMTLAAAVCAALAAPLGSGPAMAQRHPGPDTAPRAVMDRDHAIAVSHLVTGFGMRPGQS